MLDEVLKCPLLRERKKSKMSRWGGGGMKVSAFP